MARGEREKEGGKGHRNQPSPLRGPGQPPAAPPIHSSSLPRAWTVSRSCPSCRRRRGAAPSAAAATRVRRRAGGGPASSTTPSRWGRLRRCACVARRADGGPGTSTPSATPGDADGTSSTAMPTSTQAAGAPCTAPPTTSMSSSDPPSSGAGPPTLLGSAAPATSPPRPASAARSAASARSHGSLLARYAHAASARDQHPQAAGRQAARPPSQQAPTPRARVRRYAAVAQGRSRAHSPPSRATVGPTWQRWRGRHRRPLAMRAG